MAYVIKNLKLLNIFKFGFDASVWNDSAFQGTTDEQLEDLLEFVAKKSISNLTPDESFEVILLAKREIYWKLATATAPLYSINVDGTQVNKDQRFDHYLSLIKEIDSTIRSGITSSVSVGEAFLSNRHFDRRNYENTPIPVVELKTDNVYGTKVEFSWEVSEVTKFYSYIIYISNTKDIIDNYRDKGLGSTHIATDQAKEVAVIYDIHQKKYRIEGLEPSTTYYLAVVCFNCNTVYGHSTIEFTTEVE